MPWGCHQTELVTITLAFTRKHLYLNLISRPWRTWSKHEENYRSPPRPQSVNLDFLLQLWNSSKTIAQLQRVLSCVMVNRCVNIVQKWVWFLDSMWTLEPWHKAEYQERICFRVESATQIGRLMKVTKKLVKGIICTFFYKQLIHKNWGTSSCQWNPSSGELGRDSLSREVHSTLKYLKVAFLLPCCNHQLVGEIKN